MDESSDEALVARVVATGDTAAFETLVRRHQSKVRNWLRQLTRDPARADDLAQETFIRTWQRLRTFEGRGKFTSWVMKIAFNSFLQAKRRPDYGTTVEWNERAIQAARPLADFLPFALAMPLSQLGSVYLEVSEKLAGRTAGIVGYGAIGRALAWRLTGLGMTVLSYDPYAEGTALQYRPKDDPDDTPPTGAPVRV